MATMSTITTMATIITITSTSSLRKNMIITITITQIPTEITRINSI